VLPNLEVHDPVSTWVLFFDDDDVWHPRRLESYAAAAKAAPESVDKMFSPVYALNTEALRDTLADGSGDVIRREQLILKTCSEDEGTDNYWSITTRLSVWQSFFAAWPAVELKSIYSDVGFCHFLFPQDVSRPGSRAAPEHVLTPLGNDNWMYLWRQDHAGNPQHTEQQTSRLMPVVRQALESYFGRPRNKKQFVENMAGAMGPAMSGMAAMFETVFTLDMMVSSYIEPLVNAEGAIELFRMLLRCGAMTLEDVKRSNFGEKIHGRADTGDDAIRAAMAPNAVRQERVYDQVSASASQTGLGELFSKVSGNTMAIVHAYKTARLDLMAKRGFTYEPLSANSVQAAFITCMSSGSLTLLQGSPSVP
jgi:hypothetical protein